MADQINPQNIHASVSKLLGAVSHKLSTFLKKILPTLFEDWWKQAVIANLSFQQQRQVEQRRLESLESLDLAALLRVLDQNWYQISTRLNLSSESRHFVKEMQTVRNRWAHTGSEGFPSEDVYRDLDTLQRFATLIDSDEKFVEEIRSIKSSLIEMAKSSPRQVEIADQNPSGSPDEHSPEFELGQIVSLRSNPAVRGAIVAMLPGTAENRFKVFTDGATQIFYSSQLQPIGEQDAETRVTSCDQFHAYLTALQIQYPGLSTLYSLNAARVDFIPYQFRPVLKFIRSDRPRMLIADSVGVGKTIEAGLILRELQARRDIRSILIVCPRPLITERKWLNEMKRFEERFNHLDGSTLRYCINEMDLDGVWPEQYQRAIIPFSLFDEALLYGSAANGKRKRKKGLLDLDPPPRFDLVIIDEAHHIRNQETFSHKAVRFFCDNAEAVIFLTATPIQLGNHDLFVLLNTLRPDLIIDPESFEHMAGPNPFINQAAAFARSQLPDWSSQAAEALERAASTPWGQAILQRNPEFERVRSKIAEPHISMEERVQLITDIEALHTFSGIINRTRRRDIGDFTIRNPETVIVEFTPAQKQLHDDLLSVQAEIFSRLHDNVNVMFMMTTIRRQAASCLFGLAPFLESILHRHIDELSWDEADDTGDLPQDTAIDTIQSRIQAILDKARSLDPQDPKLDALRKILSDKQTLANNKVMLFSSFRHTLYYLYEHLKADGFRIGMIHGGTPDEERIDLRTRFEMPQDRSESLDVLLFSEIGCEGLDYQFCDCIVNYDLPWNPMRIEQRIGRIDRKGQKSEKVAIFNLITPGTVDADIYERCLLRIGVFNNALGGSEEILGEITREIKNIADNLSLSEEDRGLKLQQLADNKIRLIREQEDLEQKQLELFGIRLPEDRIKKDIEEASSFWLTPASIKRLVTLYIQNACGKEQEFILGDKPLKTLRLSQESRGNLLRDFQKLPRQNTVTYRVWENWLKGGNQHQPITFESDCAVQNPEAFFIMPLHPLVKQAANAFDTDKRVVTSLEVHSKEAPVGDYKFAIYKWQFHGIKEDLVLRPVASSEEVTAHLPSLLGKAKEAIAEPSCSPNAAEWDDLDNQHYKHWNEAREEHRYRTKELAKFRRESLTTSHRARIALLQEQLVQADNEKIRRMRQSQILTAEADYARRIQDLEIAMERADITAVPVAYGVLTIKD